MHLSVAHADYAVRIPSGQVSVVRHPQDCPARLRCPRKNLAHNCVGGPVVETARGLVAYEQSWVHAQRTHHRDALLLASRVCFEGLRPVLFQLKPAGPLLENVTWRGRGCDDSAQGRIALSADGLEKVCLLEHETYVTRRRSFPLQKIARRLTRRGPEAQPARLLAGAIFPPISDSWFETAQHRKQARLSRSGLTDDRGDPPIGHDEMPDQDRWPCAVRRLGTNGRIGGRLDTNVGLDPPSLQYPITIVVPDAIRHRTPGHLQQLHPSMRSNITHNGAPKTAIGCVTEAARDAGPCAGRRGGSVKPSVAALFLVILVGPTLAQECADPPPIEKCPSLLFERCKDRAFRKENSATCLKLGNQHHRLQDPLECNPTVACRRKRCLAAPPNSIKVEIQEFLKSCGLKNCPASMKGIEAEFGSIGQQLQVELNSFRGILDLDLTILKTRELLCKYSVDDMTEFRSLAERDRKPLTERTARLSALRDCSMFVGVFVTGSTLVEGLTPELKNDVLKIMKEESERAKEAGNRADQQIDKLNAAPAKIKALNVIYDLACR